MITPGTPRFYAYWVVRFFLYLFLITLTGGILGSVLFPLVGTLLGMDYPLWVMIRRGFLDLAFYFFIWAPAISLVICIMQARKVWLAHPRQSAQSETLTR